MSNQQLMQRIRSSWAGEIAAAVETTNIPADFLAALIANESGGNADAVRFEPMVFAELAEVILGTRKHYSPAGIQHPLERPELLAYVEPGEVSDFTDCLERLAELSTSRGLTQIMGWHAVEMAKPMPSGLWAAADYLHFTAELLTYFANKYTLDVSKDFPELLRCWNTGKPDGTTFDPHYVSNGLSRMDVY